MFHQMNETANCRLIKAIVSQLCSKSFQPIQLHKNIHTFKHSHTRARAQTKHLYSDQIHLEIYLKQTSMLSVQETIDFDFYVSE